MNGSINLAGNSAQQSYGYSNGLGPGSFHTSSNLSGSIIMAPSKQDAMLSFASAAFAGFYASDLSLAMTDDEKVSKAWDLAEKLFNEGARRGYNFY